MGRRHADSELREGYTTGTCAAAAAAAGLHFLFTGGQPETWTVPLPVEGTLVVPIAGYEPEDGGVRVSVIKDAGDDPDATHGAVIQAVVHAVPDAGCEDVLFELDGGRGVGRVTLPGLPVPVGEPAINPGPRAQIEAAVRETAEEGEFYGTVRVLVEVPEGEAIATKTMNARLGITGGISILGTGGIVRPYSHDSWRASIDQGMDVALASGLQRIVLTTGRRTERFYLERFPDTFELGIVQAADFFEHSMRSAAEKGFSEVVWSVFFGKLVKQAMGFPYTHAGESRIDFTQLADWCGECLISEANLKKIRMANTAMEAAALLQSTPHFGRILALLITKATGHARSFAASAGTAPRIGYSVFNFEGRLLMSRTPA